MIDPGLKNRVVLVTGGNNKQGIGAATAKAFATQGAKVFITYLRTSPQDYGIRHESANRATTPGLPLYHALQTKTADEVVQAIRQQGGEAEAGEADLADPTAIPKLFDQVETAFGPVEVLINNAAQCRPDTFVPINDSTEETTGLEGYSRLTITADVHDRHFAVNSRAVALMMAEFARRHIHRDAKWGRIINVSTDGASGFTGSVSYGASKHALESYSRAAASELGTYGVTVNVLSLGPVQTAWISRQLEEQESPHIPLERIGQPEDVADVMVFFASEQARWITGQLLYVGGGHVMPL